MTHSRAIFFYENSDMTRMKIRRPLRLFLLAASLAPSAILDSAAFAAEPCYRAEPGIIDQSIEKLMTELRCPECKTVMTRCKLSRLDKLPEVVVVGEDHTDAISKDTKGELFRLAKRGKLQIATEIGASGPAFPWSTKENFAGMSADLISPNIHGIESTIPHALSSTYSHQYASMHGEPPETTLESIGLAILIQPLFRGAYEDLRTNPVFRDVYGGLDPLLEAMKKKSEPQRTPEVALRLASVMKDVSPWVRKAFFYTLHKRIIDQAKSNFATELKDVELGYLLTPEDEQKMGLPDSKGSFSTRGTFGHLLLKTRNRDFAGKISDLICQLDGTQKPLVVIVGELHTEGVIRYLKGLSNGRMQIRHFVSFDPKQSNELLREAKANSK